MWKLKPGWFATVDEKGIIFHSDTKAFRLTASADLQASLFHSGFFLIDCKSDTEGYQDLISALFSLGVITNIDTNNQQWSNSLQSQYYFHIDLNPNEVAARFEKTNLLILGIGGIGSILIEHLVPSGIERIIYVDDDIVELSNLERQFIYSKDSVGNYKVDAAREYSLLRNKTLKVEVYQKKITDSQSLISLLNEIGKIDLCAICIDQPSVEIFDLVSGVLWERDVPFLHGGVMLQSGFFGPFFLKKMGSPKPQYFSLKDIHPIAEPTKICFSPYNTIIASYMAAEILHFIAGAYNFIDFKSRSFWDFKMNKFQKVEKENFKNEI